VPGNKTRTNPEFPEWIKEDIEHIRNWFRGEWLGDGSLTFTKSYSTNKLYIIPVISYMRTIEITDHKLKEQLKQIILLHENKRWNKRTKSHELRSRAIPENLRQQLPKPKLLQAETEILENKLNMKCHICISRVSYHIKTDRITVRWSLRIYGKNALRFWRFLNFMKKPWIKSEKVKEAKQKIDKIRK